MWTIQLCLLLLSQLALASPGASPEERGQGDVFVVMPQTVDSSQYGSAISLFAPEVAEREAKSLDKKASLLDLLFTEDPENIEIKPLPGVRSPERLDQAIEIEEVVERIEEDEDRDEKSLTDTFPFAFKDEENDFKTEEVVKIIEEVEERIEEVDDRNEKSLINTFPFNIPKDEISSNINHDHGHQEHSGSHGDHHEHSEDHSDHSNHHAKQESQDSRFGTFNLSNRGQSGHTSEQSSHHNEQNNHHSEQTNHHSEQTNHHAQQNNRFGNNGNLLGNTFSFPFAKQDPNELGNHEVHTFLDNRDLALANDDENIIETGSADIKTDLASVAQAAERCVEKVMLVEETVHEESIECHHSYSKKCHTSYITSYEPTQEEKCDERFIKKCYIEYKLVVYNETVEVCHNPLVKNCDKSGPVECTTVYESECSTKQHVHEVEEDVANCVVEQMEKCRDVTQGYTTTKVCDKWPVNRCSLEKKTVKKYSPETKCHKVPTELCGPRECTTEPGPRKCRQDVKPIAQEIPEESCNMQPEKNCNYVTKLVPVLKPKEECLDVPKEVCQRIRGPAKKVKKPVIKKWCYVPSKETGLTPIVTTSDSLNTFFTTTPTTTTTTTTTTTPKTVTKSYDYLPFGGNLIPPSHL